MRTKFQTDKRIVTHIITDIGPLTYDEIKGLLLQRQVPMDGMLLEMNSKKAYVWEYKNESRLPDLPNAPDDAPAPITA